MGEEKKAPEVGEIIENPQTPEDYLKNTNMLIAKNEATTAKLNANVEKVIKENEELKTTVAELKGDIERVRVNVPPLIDHSTGKQIPVVDATSLLHMSNEEVKEIYDWWANGPVFRAKQQMRKVTTFDQKQHDEYVQKMQPLWAQKALTSEAYKHAAQTGVREKAGVLTGAMGLEQTGYGLEWAPVQIAEKIIALATYESVILKEAQRYPLSVHKTSWPTADYTGFAVKWPATELYDTPEDPDVIATSTFALQAKWGYILALLGKQFIINCQQYGIAAVDSVLTFMKHAAAVKFDTVAWTGTSGAGICDGLEVLATITDVNLTAGDDTFAEIIYTDLVNFKYELEQRYRAGAKIYGSPKFISTVRVMEDTNGNLINPLLAMPNPLGIDGTPLVEVDVANETEADTKPVCVYGNLKNTFAYGFLQDMVFDSTTEKYWVEGGVLFRLEFWADMGVTLPTAMRRLLFNTA